MGLADQLAASQVLVGPMDAEEVRRAIELPAGRAGLRVEPALSKAMVADVAGEPGGLPLLSTALLECWEVTVAGHPECTTQEATGHGWVFADDALAATRP